ncbi:ATP-binding protein [Anoxybacterium hadale]|uniref:ATP-binding protein n=1 Tax=Anoxybacterium hadale TaxID=3408580 RepID=A0ACD1ABS2_9FIRM|nr:ATP-binding protein [Clostridiales bacterium]
MSIFHIDINNISMDNIDNLINDEVVESKTLEYKREFNFDTRSARVEFLYDLTAMANSGGGDIIFGIEDCDGKPRIIGLPIDSLDTLKLKIESILRDCVTPRLKYEIKPIKTKNDRYIIIIRICEGTNVPHMVLPGGSGFYKRNHSGKQPMSIDELRECFMTSAGYSKEAYLFHLKDELEYNKEVMDDLKKYLFENPPIKSAFEAVNAGTLHFRLEAWNAIVRAGILPFLTYEQQSSFQAVDKSIRNAARLIQMVDEEWKRIVEFHDWDISHKNPQPAPLKEECKNKRWYLNELIDNGIRSIEKAINTF